MMRINSIPIRDNGLQHGSAGDHDRTALQPTQIGGIDPVTRTSHDLQFGLASDPGRVRDHNEDTSLALQFM